MAARAGSMRDGGSLSGSSRRPPPYHGDSGWGMGWFGVVSRCLNGSAISTNCCWDYSIRPAPTVGVHIPVTWAEGLSVTSRSADYVTEMPEPRVMALRRPDVCVVCGTALGAGTRAEWNPNVKVVTCLACVTKRTPSEPELPSAEQPPAERSCLWSLQILGRAWVSYPKDLPVDVLKIDCSFVAELPGSTPAMEIVAAAVELSHRLGLRGTARVPARGRDGALAVGLWWIATEGFSRLVSAEGGACPGSTHCRTRSPVSGWGTCRIACTPR
jgi:hypothetical protein